MATEESSLHCYTVAPTKPLPTVYSEYSSLVNRGGEGCELRQPQGIRTFPTSHQNKDSLVPTRLVVSLSTPLSFPSHFTLLPKLSPLPSNVVREKQKPNQNFAMRRSPFTMRPHFQVQWLTDGSWGTGTLLARTPTDTAILEHSSVKCKMLAPHHSASSRLPQTNVAREMFMGNARGLPAGAGVHHTLGYLLALLLTRSTLICASSTNSHWLRFRSV